MERVSDSDITAIGAAGTGLGSEASAVAVTAPSD